MTVIDDRWSTAFIRRWTNARNGHASVWVRRMMEDPAERLSSVGLSVRPIVKRGDPKKVLVAEAVRWEADNLFVGARGVTGIKRFLLGSVSTAVAMHALCTVEVVRPVRRSNGNGAFAPRRVAIALSGRL